MAPRPSDSVLIQTRVQAAGVLGLGLAHLMLAPTTLLAVPPVPAVSGLLHPADTSLHKLPLAMTSSPLLAQSSHISGVVLMSIGMAYVLSFYHQQWEWVYMAIPARLVIAGIGISTWVVAPERVGGLLALICAVDGLGAVMIGREVGFSGKAPEETKGAGSGSGMGK